MAHSYAQPAQLTCPQCGQNFFAGIWLIVDLAERPDLAEQVRAGTLHDLPCPHCGHRGQVDAPLLLFRPGEARPLLFSPAEGTTAEQDREQAAQLIATLRQRLGDSWQEAWLAEGLPHAPRPFLAAALSTDPEAALRELQAGLEAGPAPNPLLETLRQFITAGDWNESYRFLLAHPELLSEETDRMLVALQEGARQAGDEGPQATFAEYQALLRRCGEIGALAAFAEKLESAKHGTGN